MGIEKGKLFRDADVYIDYPFEAVMYRWDHVARDVHVRFYGADELAAPVAHDNHLFNEAIRFGTQVTRERYEQGNPVV
ncbi:hypothetical protein RO07_00590 [Pandoraea pulmonicola]|uniref:Uncharacterized protein n=1 Tax=Pandoraea pulmonicola TaxID=93221 RepID=A0AAJ4ZG71_PANPU|nr:hypothetical protein RO07_00590 [Pandoraea pulmonicola]SUA92641.1 Uncharacterised protein [Pandoraea pulmonicola]